MTKKDYDLIAMSIWRSGAIPNKNKIRQEAREKMRRLIALDLGASLKKDNPQFDMGKFFEACGLNN